jgi:hypothetical protein
MSLEVIEDEVKRKFTQGSSVNGGSSVHESGARELLYPHATRDTGKKDDNNEAIYESVIDVDARTELPAPSATATIDWYPVFLDKAFGKGKGRGMRAINERYKINMISKNRKGRIEYTTVATASALTSVNEDGSDKFLKKVQES